MEGFRLGFRVCHCHCQRLQHINTDSISSSDGTSSEHQLHGLYQLLRHLPSVLHKNTSPQFLNRCLDRQRSALPTLLRWDLFRASAGCRILSSCSIARMFSAASGHLLSLFCSRVLANLSGSRRLSRPWQWAGILPHA